MPDVDGQIVLGLDVAQTTQRISQDLNQVLSNIGRKEITLSAKIENIKSEQITSQINNIAKQLNQSLTVKDIKVNVSLEQSNIERIRNELSGLKISDSGAKELTKEFTSMNVALEKVQHKWVEVKKAEDDGTESTQKLLNLMIQGSTEQGKLVSITKQFNVETGEVVRTQTAITDNLKAQQKEQDAVAKKAQADNDARIKYLSQQKSLLDDIQAAYTGQTSTKGVKDDSHLSDLKKQYDEIKATITQLEQADGALSQKQKSNISSQIADLKRLAKEYQNAEYVATQLRTKDIAPIKEEQLSKLTQFESKLENAGILTTEFRERINGLNEKLNKAFDKETLTAYLNSFDLLKADVTSFQQEIRGLNAQYKALETVQQKITGIEKSMIGIDKNSNQYQALNQQLQLQYEYRQRITSEIEKTISIHPELVQYSKEFNNYIIQTSENATKLAVEEAKVADQVAKTADNYRNQAKNNSLENNVSALEAKFRSLNDVSSDFATNIKNEFLNIRSLMNVISTSNDNKQVVNAYDQYSEAIKRVSNNLDILKRQEKSDITPIKDEQLRKINEYEKYLDRSNILTDDFKGRINELRNSLLNVFDRKSLTAFLSSFDLLKADARSVKQEMAGLEAQFKLLETVDNKITNLQKQKIHTQVDSNEYNVINQQLQQQYTIRRQIASEIEKTATIHPELLQQSQELSKYLQQSHENAAKLAQEEAKVADQLSKVANGYRTQAKNNSFENSIGALEARFLSLKNVSSDAAQTMQNEFANLRSLAETIATSTDNSKVVSAYNEYDEAIKRTSNSLDILARESKTAEQATREHEKAVKDDAAAQLTLTRSSTLSNTIESWMNQNTKAAQAYGDKLREIQNILANNTNSAMLVNARAEFAKIKSEAKAAGLITNQFATSIKNTALQLLGLSSGIMVIRKIISVIKEGVNTVVELDTALVDLQKTTTMSGSDLVSFYEDANDAAKELGVTTKDIIQSAADWSRLGYSDKNSSTMMAKLAAQFAAISPGVDIGTATTGLVSVMKAYGIEAEEVLDGVMSKINIIGNTAATSNAEIINGLKNSSSAMAAMNSTLEENIALFTAAQEITQDDSKVGNALRSISMRIRGYDEETGELSEELANITGEVYDLTKATEDSQGVSLFTDTTQEHYKSIYQYLKDISEVYDDLSEKQQQQLMEKLFGKNRASVGQAILQNFQAAEKAMDNMAKSAGNADAEMDVITKSLEYKLNALKETSVGIFQNLFKRDEVGVVIDSLTGLLSIVDKLTSALGPLGTAFAGIGIVAFVKNFG